MQNLHVWWKFFSDIIGLFIISFFYILGSLCSLRAGQSGHKAEGAVDRVKQGILAIDPSGQKRNDSVH